MTNLQNQSDAWLIIKEAVLRFQEKSPKFFRVIKLLNAILVILGGGVTALNEAGIVHFPLWIGVISKYITGMGGWGYIMSNLAVSKPTNEIMPFTEKKNMEKKVKEDQERY